MIGLGVSEPATEAAIDDILAGYREAVNLIADRAPPARDGSRGAPMIHV